MHELYLYKERQEKLVIFGPTGEVFENQNLPLFPSRLDEQITLNAFRLSLTFKGINRIFQRRCNGPEW